MLTDSPIAIVAEACVAAGPGCIVWWQGRALSRAADDPLLPERLHASRRPALVALGVAWVVLVVGWPDHLYWSIPFMLVMRLVGAFPLRRHLFEERWSLGAYLWFFTRAIAATFGFWVVLQAAPWLTTAAGGFKWYAAVAVAALLLLWNRNYAGVLRRLLGTRAIADPDLLSRFGELAARAGLPSPRVDVVDVGGGNVVNALALPSLGGSGVLMTSSLLERFDRDEIVAVFAHELAHIEHYDVRRLRRLAWKNSVLAVAGSFIGPAAEIVGPNAASACSPTWA